MDSVHRFVAALGLPINRTLRFRTATELTSTTHPHVIAPVEVVTRSNSESLPRDKRAFSARAGLAPGRLRNCPGRSNAKLIRDRSRRFRFNPIELLQLRHHFLGEQS